MKKMISFILLFAMLSVSIPAFAENSFAGNTQLIYDAIRWNLNLPKQSMLTHAEEYLFKMNKEITLHALLMEVTLSPELEMLYGTGGKIVLIDLDTGDMIDYKNFDGNVVWPDSGDVTSKYDALHLLYNAYWSCLDDYNDFIMSEYEFVTPISEEDVAAINTALTEAFIR